MRGILCFPDRAQKLLMTSANDASPILGRLRESAIEGERQLLSARADRPGILLATEKRSKSASS